MSVGRFIKVIHVADPDTGGDVELEVWKDTESGGIFAVDSSFLDQVEYMVNSPFNDEKIELPQEQVDQG